MIRRSASIQTVLAALVLAPVPGLHAAEVEIFDEGPLAGTGYPFSESARVGDVLFLAGQIGVDKDGKLVPGGIRAEAEQVMLNIEAALARRGLAGNHRLQRAMSCSTKISSDVS
jgi:enamine deaminase RidA (YjgF/YER057c/UK114 family)